MSKETITRAIVGVVLFILNGIKVKTGVDLFVGDEFLYAIADACYACWVGYKNNDFSTVSARFTKIMRKVKKLVKTGDLSLLDAIENAVTEWEKQNDNH